MNIIRENIDEYINDKIKKLPNEQILLDFSEDDISSDIKEPIDSYLTNRILEQQYKNDVQAVLVRYEDYCTLISSLGAKVQYIHLDFLSQSVEAIRLMKTNVIPV